MLLSLNLDKIDLILIPNLIFLIKGNNILIYLAYLF